MMPEHDVGRDVEGLGGAGSNDHPQTGELSDEIPVPEALEGERVDRAVAVLTGWSRGDVQALVAAGCVLVDGAEVVKSHRLGRGERIRLTAHPEPTRPPDPEPIALAVRFEDDHIVVLSKPAGMVVHPGAGNESGTLVNALLARYPDLADVGDPMRPGIVHRLDRGTSGLLVVARTAVAYERLVEMMSARIVERGYQSLVWGHVDPARGVIDAPVGRSPTRRTRMAVTPAGREARTAYEVIGVFDDPDVTLLGVSLETGRTHQIRVHLAAIGHPVVGDDVYGGKRQPIAIDRPFLHAWRLAFPHPIEGEPLVFEEALPHDLRVVLDGLG